MTHRLRTFFGVNDDLQEFAEHWLNSPAYLADAKELTYADGALVACVYRDDVFQVELCSTPGGLVIPDHTHPHADTIEVSVAGALRLHVNGRDPFAGLPDAIVARRNKWRGIRINHDDVHGTTVGHPGAMFFSIQKWLGCAPMSVLTDYAGKPLGAQHRAML
jgi:quercetin dioxygenase-like cupin family protein